MKQKISGLFIALTLTLSSLSYGIERGATTVEPNDSITIQVFEEIEESCLINYQDLRTQVLKSKKIILKQRRCKQVHNNSGSVMGYMGKITIIR